MGGPAKLRAQGQGPSWDVPCGTITGREPSDGRMTMAGSLRGVPVVDKNRGPVETAGIEVLQRL